MFLIIDENVDDAVGHYLRERGHRVGFVRDLFAGGIKDPVIAVLGNEDSAIIVTHDKDFKGLVKRAPEGTRQRFRKLGRISLQCKEPQAKKRIENLIESIEFEFLQVNKRPDPRVVSRKDTVGEIRNSDRLAQILPKSRRVS